MWDNIIDVVAKVAIVAVCDEATLVGWNRFVWLGTGSYGLEQVRMAWNRFVWLGTGSYGLEQVRMAWNRYVWLGTGT
jgi:peptidoglycan/LPS O-acetylase OafA/YrhL